MDVICHNFCILGFIKNSQFPNWIYEFVGNSNISDMLDLWEDIYDEKEAVWLGVV